MFRIYVKELLAKRENRYQDQFYPTLTFNKIQRKVYNLKSELLKGNYKIQLYKINNLILCAKILLGNYLASSPSLM